MVNILVHTKAGKARMLRRKREKAAQKAARTRGRRARMQALMNNATKGGNA